jgi:hypothetical protein
MTAVTQACRKLTQFHADFLHFAIWMGCTLNCDPNWLSVFSPRIASIATRALNFGLYCFLVVVIDLSFVNDSVEILAYCVL